jgi:hypothetical protein
MYQNAISHARINPRGDPRIQDFFRNATGTIPNRVRFA